MITFFFIFFFNDTATTEIYTLSLHDALPISNLLSASLYAWTMGRFRSLRDSAYSTTTRAVRTRARSEEHTSELQSHSDLVCRLLLEKKKYITLTTATSSRRASGLAMSCILCS